MRNFVIACALLLATSCTGTAPAYAQSPSSSMPTAAPLSVCMDMSVMSEVIVDAGLDHFHTFGRDDVEVIKSKLKVIDDIVWTEIEVLHKKGVPNVLILFRGIPKGQTEECVFNYGDQATVEQIRAIIDNLRGT